MNETASNRVIIQLIHLKDGVIWMALGLGLTANVLALIVTGRVKIGLPFARLLARLQFVWDGLGCIILALYWVTCHIYYSDEVVTEVAVIYTWASFFSFILQNNLSANNILLITLDRFWSVVYFRTYPRDSKFYRITLVVASFGVAVIFTSLSSLTPYFIQNMESIGVETFQMYMKIQSICVFIISYLTPAVLVLILNFKILLVLRKLKRVTLTNISSTHEVHRTMDKGTAQNVRSASLGIIIIIITFLLARICCQLVFIFGSFGVMAPYDADGWQTNCVHLYSANFIVNPFALILTSALARTWVWDKLSRMVSYFRRWRIPSSIKWIPMNENANLSFST